MTFLTYALDELFSRQEVIEFDATTLEEYQDSATVTIHPVEYGQDISDYSKPEPSRLRLSGIVSNTPIQSTRNPVTDKSLNAQVFRPLIGSSGTVPITVQTRRMVAGAQVRGGELPPFQPPVVKVPPTPLVFTAASYAETTQRFDASTLQFPAGFDRASAVYKKLVELQQTATPLSLVTSLREYPKMLLSSVRVSRSEAEDAIEIDLELIQFIEVSVLMTDARTRSLIKAEQARNEPPPEAAAKTPKYFGDGEEPSVRGRSIPATILF